VGWWRTWWLSRFFGGNNFLWIIKVLLIYFDVYAIMNERSNMPKQKMQRKSKKAKKPTHGWLILLTVICFAIGGVAAWQFLKTINQKPSSSDSSVQNVTDEEVNNQQKDASVDESKEIVNENTPTENDETAGETRKQVTIFVVDAGSYDGNFEVRAFANEISEDDGSCIITLQRGANEVKRTVNGLGGGTKTDCVVDIPLSEFGENGTWQLIINYVSLKSVGETKKDVIIKEQ
jgi:hypothetical protein